MPPARAALTARGNWLVYTSLRAPWRTHTLEVGTPLLSELSRYAEGVIQGYEVMCKALAGHFELSVACGKASAGLDRGLAGASAGYEHMVHIFASPAL